MEEENYKPKLFYVSNTDIDSEGTLTLSDFKDILVNNYSLTAIMDTVHPNMIAVSCYSEDNEEDFKDALYEYLTDKDKIERIIDCSKYITEGYILESEVYVPQYSLPDRNDIEMEKIVNWILEHKILNESNMITINSDHTIDVDGDVNLSESQFCNLPEYIQFNYITGRFSVNGNQNLKSLEGFPKHINESLDLRDCDSLDEYFIDGKVDGGIYHN